MTPIIMPQWDYIVSIISTIFQYITHAVQTINDMVLKIKDFLALSQAYIQMIFAASQPNQYATLGATFFAIIISVTWTILIIKIVQRFT